MSFQSILYENLNNAAARESTQAPDYFIDLNLDQIVESITAGREEYNLKPFYHLPLGDVDQVEYRHEVFRDLGDATLAAKLKTFAKNMRRARALLAISDKAYYTYEKRRWFLDAVGVYCGAVRQLATDLSESDLESRGFTGLKDYLSDYTGSDRFVSLERETRAIQHDLSEIRYSVLISGPNVKVRKYDEESDYSADVEETFRKFQQGAVNDYRLQFKENDRLNQVEARILNCVADLFPDIFLHLSQFCTDHEGFIDTTVESFDREVQFYLSYLDFVEMFRAKGLYFCLPEVSDNDKEIEAFETFDAALAYKLISNDGQVVTNGFHLSGRERIIVVSGPNQGGKTTFARTFGQLHFLSSLGCLVPGSGASLFHFDRLFTHFEKEERVENVHGKLEDDLLRIHSVLEDATPASVVVMNEIFNSTTLQDAIFLGERVMRRLISLDLIGVCVTFVDELASLSDTVVSMASTVEPDNPAERTFKIIRKPADGLAYALSVAEKHGLTYDSLKERLAL